jgi:uncharacterized repeat protein (TIGR02543 family)
MNRIIPLITLLAFVFFAACSGSSSGGAAAEKTFTVTFIVDDAEYGKKTVSDTDAVVGTLPVPPVKDGFNFAGWWTSTEGKGSQVTSTRSVTGDIKVYAYWTTETVYNVSFETNGGTVVDEEYAVSGQKLSLPEAPRKSTYGFVGWYADGGLDDAWDFDTDTVSGDLTLYARWGSPYTYTVSGTEAIITRYTGSDKELVIPSTLDGYTVTAIGQDASSFVEVFARTPVVSVVIPDTVKTIGACSFSGAKKLTSVTIPDSVTTIGAYAFSSCVSLEEVRLPDSLLALGGYVFDCCTALKSIAVGEDNNLVAAKDGVLFDKNMTTLLQYPAGRTDSAYSVPDTVTQIRGSSFYNCQYLTSVSIPVSVTSMMLAFNRNQKLSSVEVAPENSQYSSIDGVVFDKSQKSIVFYPCAKVSDNYAIPDSVEEIGYMAFSYCTGVASVSIPDSVTSIADGAFNCATGVKAVDIGSSVTSIGNSAFSSTGLTSVVLPASVETIGTRAFLGCSDLSSVTLSGDVPPELGDDSVFSYNKKGRLFYVPAGFVSAYRTGTLWSAYSDYIVAIP